MVIFPLKMHGATAHFRKKRLVGPVDITIEAEGFTIVMGPNGAGKTTLLRLMHGLQRCSGGVIEWAVPQVKAREKQAYVFQSPIMMRRKVIDSIAYPLRLRGLSASAARKEARECAGRFGLENLMDSWAPMLSGGEKQKLSLARALMIRPDILFLDEPCANLDGRAIREIEKILLDAQAAGTRIVMSTHDMGQARRLAQDVIFMYDGKIHEHSSVDAFFTAPGTKEAQAFINGEIVE